MEAVALAIQESADAAIVPRFQALSHADIAEKEPGDFVTVADHECETLLEQALAAIRPGVPVLGEEAAAVDARLAQRLMGESQLWVVDPLDGTRAFIEGDPDFSVMVSLLEAGEPVAAWVYHPMQRVMWSARRGEGAHRNGERMHRAPAARVLAELRGYVKTGFMPAEVRADLQTLGDAFQVITTGPASAGFAYPALVDGSTDFLLFWRTLPWDHAPGVLIAQESGCHVARLDGTSYRPDQDGRGLLAAADPISWAHARDVLAPPLQQLG